MNQSNVLNKTKLYMYYNIGTLVLIDAEKGFY